MVLETRIEIASSFPVACFGVSERIFKNNFYFAGKITRIEFRGYPEYKSGENPAYLMRGASLLEN